jgi:hypothetical protein
MNFHGLYGGPTTTTQIAGRGLCLVSYFLAFLVALGDLYVPSPTLQIVMDRQWSQGLALALAPLSLIGFIAVLTHLWRVEWVPAAAITFLLLQRSVPVWATLADKPWNLSAASMMTLGACCLAKRTLDLWVFSIKTKAAAERARDER